jgi:D-inositol-3-phosphate glycosyltransferase
VRVLFVSHYAVPHVGGIEFIVDRLATELTRRGHEVTHVASDGGTPAVTVPYRQILIPAWQIARDRFSLPYPLFSPRALRSTLRAEVPRADIIHAHGMLYVDCAAAFAADRRTGRNRRVLTEHVGHIPYASRIVDGVERIAIRSIGRYTARAANAIITYNGRVESEMEKLVQSRPVHIPNGVDLDMYRPARGGERTRLRTALGWDSRPRVLFVGRMVEKKGISLVLETGRRANGEFEIVLAGPGHPGDVPPHVTNMGELTRERVAELYRAADVFLLPSHGEGFPLSAQEAMASGIPVVLRDEPGYEVIVRGGQPGVRLVRPDPDAIIAAVRDLIADQANAGRAALEFARGMSWSHTIDEHLAVYEDVLRRDRSRR